MQDLDTKRKCLESDLHDLLLITRLLIQSLPADDACVPVGVFNFTARSCNVLITLPITKGAIVVMNGNDVTQMLMITQFSIQSLCFRLAVDHVNS